MAQPAPAARPRAAVDDRLASGAAVGSRSAISETTGLLNFIGNHYNTLNRDITAIDSTLADARAFARSLATPDNPGPGSAFMKGPMHFDNRNYIQCNADLRNVAEAAITVQFPADHPAKKLLETVFSYWQSANSLKQLERFVDTRQPYLNRLPTPAGGNLHQDHCPSDQYSDDLYMEYYFRRLWIRHLHFPGIRAANLGREGSFRQLYRCARLLADLERFRIRSRQLPLERAEDIYCPPVQDADQHLIINWIRGSRRIILNVIEDVASLPYTQNTRQILQNKFRARTGRPPVLQATNLTRDELFQENFKQYPTEILTVMIDRYNWLMKQRPFERLLMDLLDKEDTFERTLTVEHVEDKLINKQLTIFDEEFMINASRGSLTPDVAPTSVTSLLQSFNDEQWAARLLDKMYKTLAAMSHLNRHRRNFRLFREWIHKRPWKVMFQPYDTTGDNEWLVEAIEQFRNHHLHEYDMQGVILNNGIEPTSAENIRINMFGIKPLHWSKAMSNPVFAEDFSPCTVCNAPFRAGNTFDHTIMVLHCDHKFHIKCIFDYWDHRNRYLHTCPTCGIPPLLNHAQLGMAPGIQDPVFDTNNPSFVHNIFGYDPAPPDYDIPTRVTGPHPNNRYWEQENAYIDTYDNALTLKWEAALVQNRTFHFSDDVNPYKRWASTMTAQLRNALPGVVGQTTGYYDASRFDTPTEVAVLRYRRRIRDRNRRDRIANERGGVAGM